MLEQSAVHFAVLLCLVDSPCHGNVMVLFWHCYGIVMALPLNLLNAAFTTVRRWSAAYDPCEQWPISWGEPWNSPRITGVLLEDVRFRGEKTRPRHGCSPRVVCRRRWCRGCPPDKVENRTGLGIESAVGERENERKRNNPQFMRAVKMHVREKVFPYFTCFLPWHWVSPRNEFERLRSRGYSSRWPFWLPSMPRQRQTPSNGTTGQYLPWTR